MNLKKFLENTKGDYTIYVSPYNASNLEFNMAKGTYLMLYDELMTFHVKAEDILDARYYTFVLSDGMPDILVDRKDSSAVITLIQKYVGQKLYA